MLKERFHESLENLEITMIYLYGKPRKRDWMAKVVFLIQMLSPFSVRCNRYF